MKIYKVYFISYNHTGGSGRIYADVPLFKSFRKRISDIEKEIEEKISKNKTIINYYKLINIKIK